LESNTNLGSGQQNRIFETLQSARASIDLTTAWPTCSSIKPNWLIPDP